MRQIAVFQLAVAIILSSLNISAQQKYLSKNWESNVSQVGEVPISQTLVDVQGNSYVLTNTLTNSGYTDLILTKYNSKGTLLWTHTKDGAQLNDYGAAMTFNSAGDIIGTGALETTVDRGEVYLFKISPLGVVVWENSWNRDGYEINVPTSIDIAGSGIFYVSAITSVDGANADISIVKFDSTGNEIWVSNYDYAGEHDIPNKVFDNGGSIAVTGASASTQIDWDMLALKLNVQTGVVDYENRISVPGVGFDKVLDVTWDSSQDVIYIVGFIQINGIQKARTIKLDDDLNVLWTKDVTYGSEVAATSVLIDNNDDIVVTGYMRESGVSI